jgi:hypothetical protein
MLPTYCAPLIHTQIDEISLTARLSDFVPHGNLTLAKSKKVAQQDRCSQKSASSVHTGSGPPPVTLMHADPRPTTAHDDPEQDPG